MRTLPGGCGGEAGGQPADHLKMGNRRDAPRHPPVEADVAFVSRVAGRPDRVRHGRKGDPGYHRPDQRGDGEKD